MKKQIRRFFKYLGYTLVKDSKPLTEGTSTVTAGNFKIQIFNRSGLKECYWYNKEYGAQLTRLTKVLLRHYPGLKAVDIGANQGDSVSLVKSAADIPVISVEGDSTLADLFLQNTAQFSNVSLVRTFLSDQPGETDCTFSKVGHNMTILPVQRSATSMLTSFSSIDQLYEQGVLDQSCKLLKIDTEGFDLKIIRGGARFIDLIKPAILFELNRENLDPVEADPFSIFPWLEAHAYSHILYYESDGRFICSSKLENQRFIKQMFDYVDGKNGKLFYLDIIAFHRDDEQAAEEMIRVEEEHRLAGTV